MLDPISKMRELAEKVRQVAQEQETSVEHVLVVLTTVLLAPQTPSVAFGDSSPASGEPREDEEQEETV